MRLPFQSLSSSPFKPPQISRHISLTRLFIFSNQKVIEQTFWSHSNKPRSESKDCRLSKQAAPSFQYSYIDNILVQSNRKLILTESIGNIKIIFDLTLRKQERNPLLVGQQASVRLVRRTRLACYRRGYSYRIPESLARTSDRRNAHKYTCKHT